MKLFSIMIVWLSIIFTGSAFSENIDKQVFPIKLKPIILYKGCEKGHEFSLFAEKTYKGEKRVNVHLASQEGSPDVFFYNLKVKENDKAYFCMSKNQLANAVISVSYGHNPCTGMKYQFLMNLKNKKIEFIDREKM